LRQALKSAPHFTESPYGNGHAAEKIAQILTQEIATNCISTADVVTQ
jgi:hypothetical protein